MRHDSAGFAHMTLGRWLAVTVIAVVVLAVSAKCITAVGVDRDGTQSALMAVNLAHHGTISLSEAPPYVPSDYREPIPLVLSALEIRLMDALLGPAPADDYLSGQRLKLLKYQNLLWLLLLGVGIFEGIRLATGSFYVSLTGAAIGGVLFGTSIWGTQMLNDLATDLAGGAVLAVASPALAAGLTRGSRRSCLLAGVLFAALTLIKAAILYVFIGVIGTLLCVCLLWRSRIDLRASLRNLGIVTLAFLVIVTPWMLRNLVELGTFQVSQRAGVVLMIRAVKDGMTPEEYRGAFYVWAPHSLQGSIGSLLGFTPRDLQRGGRLQHLNRSETSDFFRSDVEAEQAGRPEDAVSYYRRARAERVKLERELAASGVPDADIETDRILQKRALSMIEAKPGKHLITTIPFLWRGATLAFPALLIAMLLAVRLRRYECAILAFPAFGLVMFYALLSHFIPRYSLPVRPILIALVVIAVKSGWDALRNDRIPAAEITLRKQQS